MKNVLFLLFMLCSLISSSQTTNGKITVAILNEGTAAVENVTVELLRSGDSAVVKYALTDNNGIAEITNIKWGAYIIKATAIGFNHTYSDVINITAEKQNITIPSLTIKRNSDKELAGVTVTGKKPFIQRLSDKLVVNVEGSIISAGSSALDVMERLPGITVDGDAISLRGRSGVLIMIDGRPTAMNGADLVNYLRGLPAGAIDRLEIITNPSAKYEAAGNSGIIDIRLKKDQRLGANGTLTLGYSQGVYPKANGGTTFNYRNKKMNVFGNYNYSYRKDFNDLHQERDFYKNDAIIGSDEKNNYSSFYFNNYTARLGADFFPAKNTIIGFIANGSFNNNHYNSDNHSLNFNNLHQPFYSFNTNNATKSHSENYVFNLNFKQTFRQGRELTADADYAIYDFDVFSRNTTDFHYLNGNPYGDKAILDGDREGRLSLKAGKIDYTQTLQKGARFDAGIRSSYVSSDNEAKFFNVFTNTSQVDLSKTNRFFYKEYNHAGYINYNKEFKNFSLQFGLRGEQTDIETEQVVGKIIWDSSYFKLFPSAFFNYKISKDQTVGISVSRRIGRPNYSQLNPFLFLTDPTVYSTGNPQLLPQLTWSYQMNYTVKNFNFTLSYSQNKDPQVLVIARILDIIPNFYIDPSADSNISIERPVNMIESSNYGLNIYAPFKIRPWWNMINNIDFLYNHFNANIGGSALDQGTPSTYIRSNHLFSFKKGWSAELNGNFFSRRRSGYALFQPQWGVAAGAQKTILKGQGTVRINVTDIFWTSVLRFGATYEGAYKDNGRARRETRIANFSFIYRFGNNKVQAERKRTTASEEERRRAG